MNVNTLISHDDDNRSKFNPVFKQWEYQDKRNRTHPCKIMNQDGLLALIKVVDTQEAYNYYAVLMSDFKDMKSERHVRQVSKERSHNFHDEVGLLNDRLTAEGSGAGNQRIFATFNQKVNKKATDKSTPRGGVDHDTFEGEEDFHVAKLRSGVAKILAESHDISTREARDIAYKFIKEYR